MNNNFNDYVETSELLKVIAHPVRLCLVKGLLKKGNCNVTYMQECLDIPQSTISQHLQKLKSAGIIKGERKGLEIYYEVCNDQVINLINLLFDNN